MRFVAGRRTPDLKLKQGNEKMTNLEKREYHLISNLYNSKGFFALAGDEESINTSRVKFTKQGAANYCDKLNDKYPNASTDIIHENDIVESV